MIEIAIGKAQQAARGQNVCGDAFVIVPNDHLYTIALADGLGHGPNAAEASQAFCKYIEHNHHQTVEELLRGAHHHIKQTRGTAGAILKFDRQINTLEFAGIGNIDLQSISATPIHPISTPGVIGHRYRKILPFQYDIHAGDLIAIYTDGISSSFQLAKYRHLDCDTMAAQILEDHKKYYDDSTCLVILVHK